MKKGINLLVLTIAITVMVILITSASVIGSGAINSANFEEYKSVLNRVSSGVNEYYLENGKLPINNLVIAKESCENDFLTAVSDKNDLENKLFVIDMDKLNISTIKEGRGQISTGDIFLVSENTQNVYYMKGFSYRSKMYFNLK